jgi:hypothetical protein
VKPVRNTAPNDGNSRSRISLIVAYDVSSVALNHAAEAEGGVDVQSDIPGTEVPAAPAQPTRMYFLRMPKPDTSDLEFQKEQVETELRAYKAACTKALAAAKLAHEHKLQRKEEHSHANEQFQVSKQDRNILRDRLRPVSDLSRQVRDQRRDINDRKSQLPASTVAELDATIAELEFKQAHEPMDRRSENNLIAEIRKLKKARPEVARFEMEYQAVCTVMYLTLDFIHLMANVTFLFRTSSLTVRDSSCPVVRLTI